MVEEFSAGAVFEEKIELVWVLEGVLHIHNKRVRDISLARNEGDLTRTNRSVLRC